MPPPIGDATAPDEKTVPGPHTDASTHAHVAVPGEVLPDYAALVAIDPQHYAIERELGRGGMGRILVARDRRLGRVVAIKELLASSETLRARLEREVRITAKLQHPSIVTILEAGAWPNGEPFYAMRLVHGQSLDKAIAARPTLRDRLGLLPNVLAAVDALAYAHSLRVIHRDLKPHNVLVGEFGETVVIDWGIAKDLAAGGAELPTPEHPASDSTETIAGAVLGTPSYMPPEQARGEPVDERADVYALGAMLYHVLAAAPPYSGASMHEILAAVVAGPPAPLAARQSGVPDELVAITQKAMAHDPEARYPTAKELADDLKKFQTGQLVGARAYSVWRLVRRWMRRYRAPIAVAAIAVILLVTGGVLALTRIVREHARAEASRAQAEDLMGFMVGDMHDKLAPLGRLDLLDAVAHEAVAYYGTRGSDLSVAERVAQTRALRSLADVLVARSRVGEAVPELRAAVAIADDVAARDPASSERQHDRAWAHVELGNALAVTGDGSGALAEYQIWTDTTARMAARDPGDLEWQWEAATGLDLVGNVKAAAGDGSGAEAAYLREQAALEALLLRARTSSAPLRSVGGRVGAASALVPRDLAIARIHVADQRAARGELHGADDELTQAAASLDAIAAAHPDDAGLVADGALGHRALGLFRWRGDDIAAAFAELDRAAQLYDQAVARDPSNVDYAASRAAARADLGRIRAARGDFAGALADFRAYLEMAAQLAARDPANLERRVDVATAHEVLGDALFAKHDLSGALAEHRAEADLVHSLDRDAPGGEHERARGRVEERLGRDLLQLGRADAVAHFRVALNIGTALAARSPELVWGKQLAASAHDGIGDALAAGGDVDGARDEYAAELALDEQRAARDPGDAEAQRALGAAHGKLAHLLADHGDAARASAEAQAFVGIAGPRAAAHPDDVAQRAEAAWAHERAGAALGALGKSTDALAELAAAAAGAPALAASPETIDVQAIARAAHVDRAAVLADRGDRPGALAELRTARAIDEAVLAWEPLDAVWKRDLVGVQRRIGDALLAQRDAAGALIAYTRERDLADQLASIDGSTDAAHAIAAGAAPAHLAAAARVHVAAAEIALGRTAEAERAALAAARPVLEAQHQTLPGDTDAIDELVRLHVALAALADPAGAATEHRAAADLAHSLATKDPANARWQPPAR